MNFKLKAMAAAVASIGAGAVGTAQAATDFIQVAGASAFHSQGEALVMSYCNANSATKYLSGVVEGGTNASHSGDVIRVICVSTNTVWGLNATLDFSYDSFGGSWRAFTATNSISIPQNTALNQEPVRTVDITTCSGATSTVTISGQAVTLIAGCGETTPQTSGGATSIGFTDAEPDLFFANAVENQPPGVTFPATLGASATQIPLLGVTWAIGTSKPLWLAMEQDQAAAGILPSSCSSNIDESNQTCAPFITKAQYKSIVQGAGDGDLHFDMVDLFTKNAAPAGALSLQRRDWGSGTQAASNAYFLNAGCSSRNLKSLTSSIAGGITVTINPSTSLVQTGLKASTFGIGHFSADKCPTSATTISGTTTGAYGCMKMASNPIPPSFGSAYPVSANVTTGFYDYTSEEQLYLRSGPSTAESKFASDLISQSHTFVNNAGFYNLTGLVTAPLTVPTTGTFYRSGFAAAGAPTTASSNMCAGLVDTF